MAFCSQFPPNIRPKVFSQPLPIIYLYHLPTNSYFLCKSRAPGYGHYSELIVLSFTKSFSVAKEVKLLLGTALVSNDLDINLTELKQYLDNSQINLKMNINLKMYIDNELYPYNLDINEFEMLQIKPHENKEII